MPYMVVKNGGSEKPHCVYKEDSGGRPEGDALGCHESEDQAKAQIAAIWASENATKELWITAEQMEQICPDCASRMRSARLKSVNVFALKQMPEQMLQGLCARAGNDPGFWTSCAGMSWGPIDDVEGFCNWLHHECLGSYPGQHEEKGGPVDDGATNRAYHKNDAGDGVESKKEFTEHGPQPRLGDALEGKIHESFTVFCDELFQGGFLNRDERIALSGAIGETLKTFGQLIDPALAARFLAGVYPPAPCCPPADWGIKPGEKAGPAAGGDAAVAEKAGKRVRRSMLADLKAAWDKFWQWANYEEEEEGPEAAECEAKSAAPAPAAYRPWWFKTWKAADGQEWLLTWTTNGFQDRERETFATKAIEEYVERHAADADKGQFDFWHVPGSEFGTIKAQAVVGRFLVEAGTFDDTPVARAFKSFFNQYPTQHPDIAPNGYGASHRFVYTAQDRQTDGTFTYLEKDRTSVLPLGAAANPYTKAEVLAGMAMTQDQKQAFSVIGRAVGVPDLAEMIEREGESRTKELEDAGIAHKGLSSEEGMVMAEQEAQQQEVSATTPAPETPPAPVAPVIPAGLSAEDVSSAVVAAMGPLVEQVKALTADLAAERTARETLAGELAGLKAADEAKIAAVNETTPAASLAALIATGLGYSNTRAVGSAEARVDGRKVKGLGAPKETPPVGGGRVGVGFIDAMLNGGDWREAVPVGK